jgi:hypothetical protein
MSEMSDSLVSNVDNSSPEIQLKYTRQNIQLRRAEVLRLQSIGMSETSIARSLGVSQAAISMDVQYLRNQANERIAQHLNYVGYEFDKILTGLDQLLLKAWGWLNAVEENNVGQTPIKDKAFILELITNIYNTQWQLITNKDPDALDRAARYVKSCKEELKEKIEMVEMGYGMSDPLELGRR